MPQTVEQALKDARLYSDDQPYTVLQLPTSAITAAAGVVAELGEPFAALIVDKDETTLIIPADAVADFSRRLPGHESAATQYRLITLDVILEPTLTGLMARVSGALADAGVPIFPLAAYARDHILVPADKFETAMRALERLRA